MYDWANSVYSLTITTAIFPIYFENVSKSIFIFNRELQNTALYSFILSISFLLVAFINPLLSGLADVGGFRKKFMTFFTLLGSIACIGLYFFTQNTLWIGITGFATATVGYAGSLVFYNAYLPQIATPDRFDKLSAHGYAMGYIGSVILLVINLLCISYYETLGFQDSLSAIRFAFLTVGVWWGAFGLFAISRLPNDSKNNIQSQWLLKGYKEANSTFLKIRKNPVLFRFLLSFFFYSMGVQTVMYIATLFGVVELQLVSDRLILVILIIQLVAIAGAYFFAYLSKMFGVIMSISIMIMLWMLVCLGAYFTTTEWEFYGLAVLVGSIMGGIQSQSRSAFAAFIPTNETKHLTTYFSFYELAEKFSIVLGTLSYGILIEITGGMRNSIILLIVFFIIASVLTIKVRKLSLNLKEEQIEPNNSKPLNTE
ncbi:MAG: MFS transporter [Bacteroidia bacterium]|nr:MFS transporter [Bacteroidia bacterium]